MAAMPSSQQTPNNMAPLGVMHMPVMKGPQYNQPIPQKIAKELNIKWSLFL